MKKTSEYTEGPISEIKIIKDFLPPPDKLVFKEDNVKVTLGLSRRSIEFFKREAKKNHTHYQKMIRKLLDLYAAHHEH